MGEEATGNISGEGCLASSPVLRAWIPLEPPSMNTLLQVIWSQRRIETAPPIRLFRSHFKSYLPKWCLAGSGPYRVDFEFHEAWYTKAGFPRKKDAPNLIKCCLDALSERYGIDDSLLGWEGSWKKVPRSDAVGIQVQISACVG